MLRYKKRKTRPGLVALHDIRPGNGAGLFLQPGALTGQVSVSAVNRSGQWPVMSYVTVTLMTYDIKQSNGRRIEVES